MLVLSAYFCHSEVLSARNKQLMITAVTKARLYGCPWLLRADSQTKPEDLREQFVGLLELMQAHIVSLVEATFRLASGQATRRITLSHQTR